MNPLTWANENLGKGNPNATPPTFLTPKPPTPPSINGQCVNGASSWLIYNGLNALLGPTAWAIWLAGDDQLEKIAGANPVAGDLVFYEPNYAPIDTGTAGHVDVCTISYNGVSFQAADANWETMPLQLITHSMSGVAGVMRIKQGGTTVTPDNAIADENFVIAYCMQVWGYNPFDPSSIDASKQAFVGKTVREVINVGGSSPEAYFNQVKDGELVKPGAGTTVLKPGTYQVN